MSAITVFINAIDDQGNANPVVDGEFDTPDKAGKFVASHLRAAPLGSAFDLTITKEKDVTSEDLAAANGVPLQERKLYRAQVYQSGRGMVGSFHVAAEDKVGANTVAYQWASDHGCTPVSRITIKEVLYRPIYYFAPNIEFGPDDDLAATPEGKAVEYDLIAD